MTDDATTNEGWVRLLDEMEAMAADLDGKGWETLAIAAGDAAAVQPEDGETDRHGYAYVVPGDDADRFAGLFKPSGFPRTEVYQATTATHLFLLTVFMDPVTETAILLAGILERQSLDACRQHARDTGTMYSHLFRVDGTLL
ncbi:MAG: hypothetical protein ACI8VE_001065, partial [Natrialbaceae archaeon]